MTPFRHTMTFIYSEAGNVRDAHNAAKTVLPTEQLLGSSVYDSKLSTHCSGFYIWT
jgi:hypothetical protein